MNKWSMCNNMKVCDNSGFTLQMLRVYGVGRKLLKAVQCFYVDNKVCVGVGNDVSEWFPVNIGL